ncbi:MAG: hypothetical protein ACI9FJ_002864, partial [Alteromonadaceae bacterium]
MAVNLNPSVAANQNVATVFNPKGGVKEVAPDKKVLEA